MMNANDTRDYIAAITTELATMSQRAGLPFLAYLLRIAKHEAAGELAMARPAARAKRTRYGAKRRLERKP